MESQENNEVKKQNPKIVVTEETKKHLDAVGNKGNTYDYIINVLLSEHDEFQKLKDSGLLDEKTKDLNSRLY